MYRIWPFNYLFLFVYYNIVLYDCTHNKKTSDMGNELVVYLRVFPFAVKRVLVSLYYKVLFYFKAFPFLFRRFTARAVSFFVVPFSFLYGLLYSVYIFLAGNDSDILDLYYKSHRDLDDINELERGLIDIRDTLMAIKRERRADHWKALVLCYSRGRNSWAFRLDNNRSAYLGLFFLQKYAEYDDSGVGEKCYNTFYGDCLPHCGWLKGR